jgi:DnaJ-class molecular chaperone
LHVISLEFVLYSQASPDEINNAFRRLSKIYHPDKHLDQTKKKMAEDVFNRLKKAHEGWCTLKEKRSCI